MALKVERDHDIGETVTFCITKWCRSITDSGEDEVIQKKPELLNHKFRLLDDDGIIQAYGYSDNSSSFLPLDAYSNSYGCTEIQYYENKEWETL